RTGCAPRTSAYHRAVSSRLRQGTATCARYRPAVIGVLSSRPAAGLTSVDSTSASLMPQVCDEARKQVVKRCWWPRAESNHRHKDFQSSALPTELLGRVGILRGGANYTGRYQQKGPIAGPFLWTAVKLDLHVHAAHVGHAVRVAAATGFLLFHQLRNHRVGGEHQAGDRRRVLQRGARHLGRVDHALLHEIAVVLGLRVEAVVALAFEHLVEHHGRLGAGVVDDDAQRLFQGAHHDAYTSVLIVIVAFQLALERLARADERHAAARDDAFLDRRARRMQRVFHAGLFFLHLDFGRGTDLDDGHAACQLRYALLQLLAIVVAGRLVDLHADLLDAALDLLFLASAVDDGGVFLLGLDLLGAAQILERRVLELETELFRDHGAAGEDRHVFEHRLAAVTEARRLDRDGLQDAADVVHHQGGERFAFHFLGDDEERLAGLRHLLEDRQQLADRGNLLVVQEDVGLLEHRHLLLGVVDEVRREIAAVELHALDELELVLERLAILDGDHAFLADLVHRIGDDLADAWIGIRRDGADLRDLLGARAGLGDLLQLVDHGNHRLVDAALQVHRVHPRSHVLHALAHDGLRQNRRGGGAVAGDVGGLRRHFLHHLRAHVLELVLELDLFRDRDAVLGYGRRAERALKHDVAALGP